MSERTREHLDTFWELVDEILNAVLFVMIGLEVLVLSFEQEYFLAGLFMIPLVLMTRLFSVGVPVTVMNRWRDFTRGAVVVMSWGGLRGGISVALALSIPTDLQERELILAVTYIIVVFSILVQGMTIKKVVSRVVFGNDKSRVVNNKS
jgi:CPA1 family monovalent cation:H+ antiporter